LTWKQVLAGPLPDALVVGEELEFEAQCTGPQPRPPGAPRGPAGTGCHQLGRCRGTRRRPRGRRRRAAAPTPPRAPAPSSPRTRCRPGRHRGPRSRFVMRMLSTPHRRRTPGGSAPAPSPWRPRSRASPGPSLSGSAPALPSPLGPPLAPRPLPARTPSAPTPPPSCPCPSPRHSCPCCGSSPLRCVAWGSLALGSSGAWCTRSRMRAGTGQHDSPRSQSAPCRFPSRCGAPPPRWAITAYRQKGVPV